ncbi:MAG TPA: class I SAM-dependent methyltransferase [Nitrospira sp.]|nr:class I SAM-dependent methyltransferase [Nitrospira sp.]
MVMQLLEETGYWESVAEEWKKTRPDRLWREHSDAINTMLLTRWLPTNPARCVLKTDTFDEAVGKGLAGLLRAHAHTVVGMDLSFKNLKAARVGRTAFSGANADVRSLPFKDDSIDVVVSNSTLDHFASLDEILESLHELHRTLRPGGKLILTLDNFANPSIAVRNLLPFSLLNRTGIVPYFIGATCGPRRLRRLLREAGFKVEEMGAVLHCPRMIAVLAARLVSAWGTPAIQVYFLRSLQKFERLSQWPTRYVTGHFIAIRAEKNRGHAPEECSPG